MPCNTCHLSRLLIATGKAIAVQSILVRAVVVWMPLDASFLRFSLGLALRPARGWTPLEGKQPGEFRSALHPNHRLRSAISGLRRLMGNQEKL